MIKSIGIFYGSSTGKTELVAHQIANELGSKITSVYNVVKTEISEVGLYPNILLGCSTWGMGDLQANFEPFLRNLKRIDFHGKRIALFGCGDQNSYPGSFADAMGIIYELLQDSGCEFVGKIPVSGYTFIHSKAQIGNSFVGLPLDEINQGDLTTARIKNWCNQLNVEFHL